MTIDLIENPDIANHDVESDSSEAERSLLRDHLIPAAEVDPKLYPRMSNMSAAFMFNAITRPVEPAPIEYVSIPLHGRNLTLLGAVSMWNLAWEAGQFRRRYFDEEDLPSPLSKIADSGDVNVSIVPRTRSRYFEYQALLHLLPKETLERFGLPLLRAGNWPFLAEWGNVESVLPSDFETRLARAWAATVWPHLNSGSRLRAFSKDDPIRLLSHNLNFWVPAVTRVIQDRLSDFPLVDNKITPGPVELIDGSVLEGAILGNPRKGGDVWTGEEDAAEAIAETVAAADSTGKLRGILDAVRSNRVEDDFSPHWSFAREDFERKMHHKRSKTSIRFVELTDTIPVQGPDSDLFGDLVTNDFLSILDPKNRQIVVLLNSGVTKKVEIAHALGYANHSAVSKRLVQIRQAALQYFRDE